MSVRDTLERLGGRAGGVVVYEAAKNAARARNISRKRRHLKEEITRRLQPIFPQLDLGRVSFFIKASLPPNWFTRSNSVEGMTFGYNIYFKGSDYQTDEGKLHHLVHELVHVDQVRRRGDDEKEFAADYGEGFVNAGYDYAKNPLEVEADQVEDRVKRAALFWYKHLGWSNGTAAWDGDGHGREVKDGFHFHQMFAGGGGVMYGVSQEGALMWYKHLGYANGGGAWANDGHGAQVGAGFNFRLMFAGTDGVMYGVTQEGALMWYKHLGWRDGTANWANGGRGGQVGAGFNFRLMFAGTDGAMYGVTQESALMWYKQLGWREGIANWANGGRGEQVGAGFNFRQMFAGTDGVVYGVTQEGALMWYEHLGWREGTANWANGGQGKEVGAGFNFSDVIGAGNGIMYGNSRV